MRRPSAGLRRLLAAFSLATLLGGLAVVAFVLHRPGADLSPGAAARMADVGHGEYVAALGDCTACHTTPGGKPFAGGLPFVTPVGTIYSSNITPDRKTGIGRYTLADFVRLMRRGVAPGSKRIYPAMPYTAYTKTSDDDLVDLFAYLKQGIAPVQEANRPSTGSWPLTMRWPLAFWDLLFLDDRRFEPTPARSAVWNRGAYLVQGFAHCGTCHTPRGLFLQEKGLDGSSDTYVSGTTLVAGSPINLRSNESDGLGGWSKADVAMLLQSGRTAHEAVTGQMGEVVQHSTQFMTISDVDAIAVYLKSLGRAPAANRATFTASDDTYRTIMTGAETAPGGRMFMDSCAGCHRLTGKGEAWAFPRLAGNTSVLTQDPSSLIAVILGGARLPSTAEAPTGLAMPGFGWRYGNGAVAQLATFIRTSWGNHAGIVTPEQVAHVRKLLGSQNPITPAPKS